MKAADDTFNLIKSLSQTEKRYFRVFATSTGNDKNYMKVFDALDGLKEYDSGLLRKKLKNKKLNVSYEKNYLQSLILKSLQSYHATDSVENEIENNIQHIRILQKKGLHDGCAKLIKKTKILCKKHELFLEQAKVLKLERALMKHDGRIHQERYFKPINNEIINQLKQEKNCIEYFHLQNRLVGRMYNKGPVENKGDKKYADLISDELLKDEKLATSLYSKCIFYNILLVYSRVMLDYPKFYFYAKKYTALKKEEYFITGNAVEYIFGLQNFFLSCLYNKHFKECDNVLHEMQSLPAKTQGEAGVMFGMFLNLKTELFIYTSKYSEGAIFIESIKNKFEKIARFMNPIYRTTTIYYCFQIFFLNGNYKKALYWMQLLMEENPKTQRVEVFIHAQIQNIMLHYELNNWEQIPYFTKSLQRFLIKQNKMGAFEKIMIGFFRKSIIETVNQKQLIAETKEKLTSVFADKAYKENTLQYFNYVLWLENKLNF